MRQLSTLQPANRSNNDGLWQSRGYGWLWSIKGDRIRIYDVGSRVCIGAAEMTRSMREPGLELRLVAGGRTLRVTDGDQAYEYVFDRIAALPDACGNEPDATPAGVVDAVDDYFSTSYPFFSDRGIDWPALITGARAQIAANTEDDKLFDILSNLLSHIPDDHVTLEGRVDGAYRDFGFDLTRTVAAGMDPWAEITKDLRRTLRRWLNRYWSGVGKTLLRGEGSRAGNDMVQYGLIDGDIGYMNLRSMEGFSAEYTGESAALKKVLDKALTHFAGAQAVIVDLTVNDGGYDHLARQIASRFADTRTLAYSKYPGDARTTPSKSTDRPETAAQDFFISPGDEPRFTGQVYVLTSRLTVSAAEIFTLAMRALPNVVHVGETTRGSLSDQLSKPLPNGWWLGLSNEIYLDADGERWEGRGIPPQIEIEVFAHDRAISGHIEAVGRVVELARNE